MSRGSEKGGVWRVVFRVSLVVLLLALAALIFIGVSYFLNKKAYNEIEDLGLTKANSEIGFTVNWDELRQINPDVVGWVYIPGTNINYPIVQTSDNQYYLTHNFRGETSLVATCGCIFLACENAGDFSNSNNIVFGHHLNDGSMFSAIANFEDADTFNSCRTVYVLSPTSNYKLKTFSLVHTSAQEQIAQYLFASEDERLSYINDKLARSVVPASGIASASEMQKTFMFSTCDNYWYNGRWVLFAYVEQTLASGQNISNGVDSSAEAGEVDSGLKGAMQ